MTGIPEIGDDGNDLIGRSPLRRIDHQQQFQEIIPRCKRALHEENIITPYTFEENWLYLTITELLDADLSERNAHFQCDLLCQVL